MVKQKCKSCSKKLSLINFKCRCEHLFCIKCKLPENHNCEYNYKDNSKLSEKLIKVINEKIIKI